MDLSAPIFHLKRQAKSLARSQGIPLHAALDQLARAEGFKGWSHLSSAHAPDLPAARLLSRLQPGDLVLLAARPGHGKTLLALDVLVEACKAGRSGIFFTLDYGPADITARLADLNVAAPDGFSADWSDDICADYVLERLGAAPKGTVAAIDYMQLLDQKRANPPLADQIATLSDGARRLGVTILLLSQVSRHYASEAGGLPGLSDLNLPNPVDLSHFARACFLQDGRVRVMDLADA